MKKDVNGKVNHNDAHELSWSFSVACKQGMSNKAQLRVFQHYNPTNLTLSACPNEKKESLTGGMQTVVGCDSKGNTIIRIEVYLYGNLNTKLCDNADEIISCFVHENDHINKARKLGYKKYSDYQANKRKDLEDSAINAQKNHHSWEGTSEGFKKAIDNYLNSFN
ncbi:MAG: hypothetical protein K5864_03580 [Bacteroidales bacterium]|nr:hypothetical protein [Bacteroidales bacterium]